jgi:hypothetical protein
MLKQHLVIKLPLNVYIEKRLEKEPSPLTSRRQAFHEFGSFSRTRRWRRGKTQWGKPSRRLEVTWPCGIVCTWRNSELEPLPSTGISTQTSGTQHLIFIFLHLKEEFLFFTVAIWNGWNRLPFYKHTDTNPYCPFASVMYCVLRCFFSFNMS